MRNLKKVLSLALALVMLLGMMVVGAGAAADFKDADKIENTEAVDVVSGIEVLKGDEKGNFNPEGTLTRAEAAVVIAKLDLGEAFGNLATTNASTFTDVAANHWAKAYIDYCAARGLIVGSAGKFMPNDKVSGVQFALMVARVLGYEDANEDLGGASWEVKAAALARKAGLTKDVTLGSQPMTRDEMAQVAFNALTADMVEYDGRAITIGNVTIPAGKATAIDPGASATNYTGTNDRKLQLCEQKFPALKLETTTTDAFERPANKWVQKSANGTVTALSTTAQNAALTYTSAVAKSKIYSDLGLTANKDNLPYVVDGATVQYDDDGAGVIDIERAATKEYVGGNGVLVQVYTDNTGTPTKVVVTNTYVGDVSSVVAATSTADAYVRITARSTSYKGGTFKTEAFDKDDVVLYTYSNKEGEKGIQSVVPAKVVTGTLTSYTGTSKAVVDGTTYKYSANVVNRASGSVDKEITLVLDTYDHIIDMTGVTSADTYAYVIQANNSGGGMYNTDWYAKLLLTDGTIVDAKVGSNQHDQEGKIVKYTVSNDVYTLTAVSETAQANKTDFALTRGSSTVTQTSGTTRTANGSTIFLVKTGADASVKYDVYKGIAQVPTIKAAAGHTVSSVAFCKSGTVLTVMFIDASTASEVSTAVANPIYVLGDADVKKTTDSKGEYYTYDAVVDGEITTIDLADRMTAPGLYSNISTNDKGVSKVSGTTGVTNSTGTSVYGTVKESNGIIGLGTGFLPYADSVKVFYVTESDELTSSDIKAIGNDGNDIVRYVTNNSKVVMIVIEAVDNEAPTDESGNIEADQPGTVTAPEGVAADKSATVSDPNATLVIPAGQEVAGAVNVTAGKLDVSKGGIAADADVTIAKKDSITAVESGKAQEAVKLSGQNSEADMASAPVNVPVYSASATNLKVGDNTDIAPKTMFLTYTGREYGNNKANVILTITRDDTGATAWTEKTVVTDKGSASGTFYVCLDNPTSNDGDASGAKFVEGKHYTVTITQVQGGETVVLSKSGFTSPVTSAS